MNEFKGTGVSRVVSLQGFDKLIAGRDIDEILTPGIVYEMREIMGVIMLSPIGESAQNEDLPGKKHNGRKFSSVILEGVYMLTKEEYQAQKKKEKRDRE